MIFKKKAIDGVKKLSWEDVKVGQFNDLSDILNAKLEDEEKVVSLVEFFYGSDVTDLTVDEFKKRVNMLSFLKDDIPDNKLKKEYTINGNKYVTSAQLDKITAAQYLEYTNCLKASAPMERILACFLFPKGHRYNDGYDMTEVYEDLKKMSIVDANSIAFFFKIQLLTYIKTSQYYLKQGLKTMGMKMESAKEINEAVEEAYNNLESYLIY